MTWLKELIEEIQAADVKSKIAPTAIVDPVEKQSTVFHEKLKQLQDKSHTVLTDPTLTIKVKETKIDLIYQETKLLFVEALHFIFTHQGNKNDSTVFHYNKDEIETPLNLPFRGSLGNLLYYFTNVFNIDRHAGNTLLNSNLDKHTEELENISFSSYLKLFNAYYFKPSNFDELKNHTVM